MVLRLVTSVAERRILNLALAAAAVGQPHGVIHPLALTVLSGKRWRPKLLVGCLFLACRPSLFLSAQVLHSGLRLLREFRCPQGQGRRSFPRLACLGNNSKGFTKEGSLGESRRVLWRPWGALGGRKGGGWGGLRGPLGGPGTARGETIWAGLLADVLDPSLIFFLSQFVVQAA